MRVFYFPGIFFMLVAFFAIGLTLVARIGGDDLGLMTSAEALWRAFDPQGFLDARVSLAQFFGREAWDSIIQPLFYVPAWITFGIPGFFMVWVGHPKRGESDDGDYDSVHLYDELSAAADASDDFDDDMAPNHDINDIPNIEEEHLDQDLVDEVDAQLEAFRQEARDRIAQSAEETSEGLAFEDTEDQPEDTPEKA